MTKKRKDEEEGFNLADFLCVLFDEDDYMWATDSLDGALYSLQIDEQLYMEDAETESGIFFVIHPASEWNVYRKKDNSPGPYRNFMFEFDDYDTIDQQFAFVESLDMPYTSAVFSGGKSVHFIISLEDAVDWDTYIRYFNFIQQVLKCDAANKDKVRFSRLPFTYRDGVEQELLYLGERIPNEELLDWIHSPAIKKMRFLNTKDDKAKERKRKKNKKPSTGLNDRDELVQWYLEEYLEAREGLVQCPVCKQDGHDESGDNMLINDDYSYRCFYDPEDHGRRMLPTISKLYKRSTSRRRRR